MLSLLVVCALLLAARLAYYYLSDIAYFPITTIKIAAAYEHVTHQELETVLAKHVNASLFYCAGDSIAKRVNRAELD